MKKPVKNYAKSVKTRLLNLMNSSGYKYMYLLARYFNERLLYRVSVSQYKDNFLLKGGSLLYAFNGLETRPTIDIDFMARRGTRFFITAQMDSIVYPMSIDIGFGDVVTPSPVEVDFPLLLGDIPVISIKAYSLETVVAEKFHAMIDRDVTNSRMKDFFDCYQILTTKKLDDEGLFEAIKATFDNRGLIRNDDLRLFSNEFYTDGARLLRWKAFMKKIQWKEELSFVDVMRVITTRLEPL